MKKILLTTLFVLFPALTFAYTPPIGIPDPGDTWDGGLHPIDTPVPDTTVQCPSWPSAESSNCYYIDNNDANCTDSSNPFGYPDRPRCDIPSSYQAGDIVEVHGSYTQNYYFTFNGTSSAPIWFYGKPADEPIFSGSITIRNSSYAFIDHIDSNGGDKFDTIDLQNDNDHISFRNIQVRNKTHNGTGGASGIGVSSDENHHVHDIVVYGCNFSELGDWQVTDSDPDFHGVAVSTWSGDETSETNNVWMLNSTCYHLSGNCIQVNAGNWPFSYRYTHHIYAGFNEASYLRQAGFWSKMASDVIFSQNVTHDNDAWGYQRGDGAGYQYNPHNLWIIFNNFHDVNMGIRQSDSLSIEDWSAGEAYHTYQQVRHGGNLYQAIGNNSDIEPGITVNWQSYWVKSDGTLEDAYDNRSVYIVGNKMYDIYPRVEGDSGESYRGDQSRFFRNGVGIALWRGTEKRYIIDNTLSDVYDGIIVNDYSPVTIKGNIITNTFPGVKNYGYQIETKYQSSHPNLSEYHVDYNNLADDYRVAWANDGVFTDNSSFFNTIGKCEHCVDVTPNFVNISNHNLNLQSTSPAIDANNSPRDVYDLFQSLYGIDIRKDFNGISRPQGNGWDMGAFEYTPSTNLRADVDNNSQINTTDAMLTLRNSLGLDMSGTNWQSSSTTGDADCDGDTDSTDAMLILRHSLGLDMSGTGWCGN